MSWREAGPQPGHGGIDRLPLVLLHGIGSNARAWAGQFAAFSADRRIVAWNAPGYAGSDPLDAAWPLAADYADALTALLGHLAIDRCVLVGQSLGAVMATAFALRSPQRVAALVLASPAAGYGVGVGQALPDKVAQRLVDLDTLGPEGLAAARYARLLTERASPEARAIVHRAMAEILPQGYAQATRLLAGADLVAAAEGLSVPTVTLWGDADVVTPPAACRRVADAVPGGRSVVIIGGGHAFATEMPDMFNTALTPVLADADARMGVLSWT
jgi:pimeloyl-ACP methyl ester carboxylesterase